VFDDPLYDAAVGCANVFDGRYCNAQLTKKSGGNPALLPEKSRQHAFGLVVDATKDLSFSVDYFNVTQTGLIGIVSADTKLQDYIDKGAASKYAKDVFTKVNNGGVTVIDYVLENYQNLGDQSTRGLDISAKARFPGTAIGNLTLNWDATYLIAQRQKDPDTGVWGQSFVGEYSLFGGTLRLKHRLEAIVERGGWEGSLAYNFQSGYADYNPSHFVNPYDTLDFSLNYKGIKNLTLSLAIQNVMDRDPPSSNQNDYFQVGYDPANTNPRGRAIGLGAKYKFF
jgi:iron complex outermembrane receptor protein